MIKAYFFEYQIYINHWDQISQTICMKETMNIADMLI